jgi:putative radical SAM enzyme (TIGR03279 family)
MQPGAIIKSLTPGSLAERVGLRPGDAITAINGKRVLDILDYLYHTGAPKFRFDVLRGHSVIAVPVKRDDPDEPLGIELEDELVDGIRHCRAKCDFCFLDQMPKGYRKSLYIKDDDYRLSFLHGNFVTLTNLDQSDWDKIRDMHLTPMNISVHATNPVVRRAILKNPQSERVLEDMERLKSWGIQMHTQIVVQPGLNDGAELDRSIREIAAFYPHVETLSVVPVGLTKWRDKCATVHEVTVPMAHQTIAQVEVYQRQFQEQWGFPFVYLSDEYYLLAEREFPGNAHYGDYPQLENGVGLCRLLITEFNRRVRYLPQRLEKKRRVLVATGASGSKVLPRLIERMNRIENLSVEMVTVANDFLGHSVTVAGLLGGRDMLAALQKHGSADAALIPSVSLREGDGVFLDDFRFEAMQAALPYPVTPVDPRGADFIAAVLGRPVTSVRVKAA